MIIPGVHPFGPVGPVWWGVCNTPLHGYDHSGHRPAPWYGYSGPWSPPGGAYAIRPYTGTIIRAIGPPRGTVIRARGARPVGRIQYAPTAVRSFGPSARSVGRMQYAPTLPAGGPSSTRPNLAGVPDAPGLFLRVRVCHFGSPLRYDHIAIFPLISFSTPPKSALSLWQIFT